MVRKKEPDYIWLQEGLQWSTGKASANQGKSLQAKPEILVEGEICHLRKKGQTQPGKEGSRIQAILGERSFKQKSQGYSQNPAGSSQDSLISEESSEKGTVFSGDSPEGEVERKTIKPSLFWTISQGIPSQCSSGSLAVHRCALLRTHY